MKLLKEVSMKLLVALPHFELRGERQEEKGIVSVNLYSVWPGARTDRAPHKLLNVNLSKVHMDKLADFLKEG